MFDLVFDAFAAFNAMIFLFGALLCLTVAACLIGYWLYWRARSIRVKARIVGVRSSGTRRSDEQWQKEYESSSALDDEQSFEEIKKDFGSDFKKNPFSTIGAYFIAMLFVLMPFVFFGVGAWFAYEYINLKTHGQYTQGVISSYEASYDSENGTSYYPVVSYQDQSGIRYNEKDRLGTGFPSYPKGQSVGVYYEAANPSNFIIDSFWRYMGFALAFMGISSVFIAVMFGGLFMQLRDKEIKDQPVKMRKKIVDIKRAHYTNQQYTPIYEFTTKQGERLQVDGDQSSNWLADKLPGKELTVMFMPHRPNKARKPGKLLLIFGLVFLVPGLFMIKVFFDQLELNLGLVLAFLGAAGYFGFQISRVLKKLPPRSEWPSFEEIKKEMKQGGFIQVESLNSAGYIMNAAEIRERLRILDRQALISVPIIIIISFGMIAGGYYLFKDMNELSGKAMVAAGDVVDIKSRSSSDGYSYYPVIAFKTAAHERIRFVGKVGSNPSIYSTGDKVLVLYDPEDPQRAIIDHGFMNWLPSLGLINFGAILMFYSISLLFGIMSRRRRV